MSTSTEDSDKSSTSTVTEAKTECLTKSRASFGGLDSVSEVGSSETQNNTTTKTEIPNRPVPVVTRRLPHLHKLEKKHSSGDLHSRLKTRKLLGVGETDDGDVHRSKLSQILGHSDQLYIRLPGGLRVWQIVLAVLFSVMSVWHSTWPCLVPSSFHYGRAENKSMLFPAHYFMTMFEVEGTIHAFPIRLYATALVCISVMYWSTVQAADRDVIRLVLLSSVVFFTLQTLVTAMAQLSAKEPFSRWSLNLLGIHMLFALIGYYFYWSVLGHRYGSLKRTTSNKELVDLKDQ